MDERRCRRHDFAHRDFVLQRAYKDEDISAPSAGGPGTRAAPKEAPARRTGLAPIDSTREGTHEDGRLSGVI